MQGRTKKWMRCASELMRTHPLGALGVTLVAKKDFLCMRARVLGYIFHPVPHIVKRRFGRIRYVIYERNAVRALVIRLRDGVKARLAGSVPLMHQYAK